MTGRRRFTPAGMPEGLGTGGGNGGGVGIEPLNTVETVATDDDEVAG